MAVPILAVGASQDDAAAVERALRDAGHAAHCSRAETPAAVETAFKQSPVSLVLVFGESNCSELAHTVKTRDGLRPHTPILLITDTIDEDIIAAAMTSGARDAICLDNIPRLQAVAGRELRACRTENALEQVMGTAQQYKHELNSLKQVTVDAIADIQEGIIVNANPAWIELFGFEADHDLTGEMIMDLCAESDRATLKGALVACQKDKWKEPILNIKSLHQDGTEFPLSINLDKAEFESEPAVRMLVSPEDSHDELPERVIEQTIQRDQATGFYNRSHFLNCVENRLQKAPSGGVRAIAYIRPDRFAKALDDIGLMGTETVLTQLAQLLREYTQPNDIYGRFGGTIFTILLERGTMADVEAWAEQLLAAISDTVFEHNEHSTAITCAMGLCEVDSSNARVEDILPDAEKACANARHQGGNCVALSESSGAAKKIRQDDDIWIPRIRGALMENRLRLEHQPIGSLNEDIEEAYDTLVRMLDEEGNSILPSEFMPVAVRTGLSKNIDRWVIGASISFCASNNVQLVFVRLSADSLKDETLVEWLITQTNSSSLNPNRICFEVAESLAVKHMRQAQKLGEALRASGFRFAIEHFGIAEDAHRIIKLVPLDFIKIDGSLMQGLHKNPGAQTEVKELARAANDKGIMTVAERVQDANTMAILWQLGINYIQGNYVQSQEIIIEDTSQSVITTQVIDEESATEALAKNPA